MVELSKVLTAENRDAVLPRFFHCSKQEAKAVSAELRPVEQPAQRTVVTVLPAPALVLAANPTTAREESAPRGKDPSGQETPSQTVRPGEPVRPEGMTTEPPRDQTVPLTAYLRRLHITVSRRFLDKLDAVRSALSHSLPVGTTEAVLEAALDLVLARDAKRKGLVANPRPAGETPPPGSRHVPAAVRRAVWRRDQGRCRWPLASGGICGSTVRVELDHTRARGQGGRSTVENTRLLCRPHNELAARLAYGEELMDRYTRGMSVCVAPRDPPCEASLRHSSTAS